MRRSAEDRMQDYERRARLDAQQGRLTQAIFWAARLVELAPESVHPRRLLADLLLRMGMTDAADEQVAVIRKLEGR